MQLYFEGFLSLTINCMNLILFQMRNVLVFILAGVFSNKSQQKIKFENLMKKIVLIFNLVIRTTQYYPQFKVIIDLRKREKKIILLIFCTWRNLLNNSVQFETRMVTKAILQNIFKNNRKKFILIIKFPDQYIAILYKMIVLYKKKLNIMQEVTYSNNEQTTNNYNGSFAIPEVYNEWYSKLKQQQRQSCYTPQQYYQWYYYQYYQNQYATNVAVYPTYGGYGYAQNQLNNLQANLNQNNSKIKKQKLSRNQKRKIKKKQLKQEYELQQKKMGKWVDVQRKDLVEQLKKIEEKQQKIKQKRKQKLSHLIEIHKEVYKHLMKKNKGKINDHKQKVGNFRRKKKKPSHIKKMKQLYEKYLKGQIPKTINIQQKQRQDQKKLQIKKQNQDNDSDYVTESESEIQQQKIISPKKEEKQKVTLNKKEQKNNINDKRQIQKKKQQTQKVKQVQIIQYKTVGKLNGYVYNGITLRQWVDHIPSPKLQDSVLRFINRLAYKQAIKKVNQPQKARKLVIAGLHECRRTLWTKIDKKKSKLIIIALNIERNNLQRGTDDQLQQVLTYANHQKVPVIHISTRSKLGRAYTGKFGPRITMVSVINYEGYQDMMQNIMEQWALLKKVYQNTSANCFRF